MGRKLGAVRLCSLFGEGELGPHLAQCGQDEIYLRTKWHLDPSSRCRLATIDMGRKLGGAVVVFKHTLCPQKTAPLSMLKNFQN